MSPQKTQESWPLGAFSTAKRALCYTPVAVVRIRLRRMGKKKQPTYRVVVTDQRAPRDGSFIEAIGRYEPRAEPSLIEIDSERALEWLGKGAQPSAAVAKLLEIAGVRERPKKQGSASR